MNGEMIALNGEFYRIDPDGTMNIIAPDETTPYAIVTHFKAREQFTLQNVKSLKDLVEQLNRHIKNRNIPYAIHLQGNNYHYLKLRAVRGSKPPYPAFKDLVKKQAIFELNDVKGDSVGFFYPIYFNKINPPGYHIHFITSDKKTGGHVLAIEAKQVKVELMPIAELTIKFPVTQAFATSKKLNKDNMDLMISSFGDGIQTF